MPYDLSDFPAEYKSSDEEVVNLGGGRNVFELLPSKVRELLNKKSDSTHGEDFSRQDSSIITAMLSSGQKPEDVFTTFLSSTRGKFASERKQGHVEDYLSRTIRKAVSYLNNGKNGGNGSISVDFGKKRKLIEGEGVLATMANSVETEKVQWLWKGYIPSGKMTIIAGDPGMGKSTIALDLVSRISQGTILPTGERSVSGTCLIASAEDSPEDTIVPRLIAAGANLSRVGIIRHVRIDDDLHYLSFPRDLERLRNILIKKGARMFIIDPLNAFLEKGTDTYKDQDVRAILAPLEAIAEETGTSIIIVAHLNKKEDAGTLYRVGGSIGFIGAARSVLAVSHTPRKDFRVIYSLKSNLAAKPKALGYDTYEIKKKRKKAEDWLGEEIITSSTVRWRGEVDFDPSQGTGFSDESKAETEAEQFLQQILADSEVSTDDIFREGRQAGVSRSQLNRVKLNLGIKASKRRDGKWYWAWPPP